MQDSSNKQQAPKKDGWSWLGFLFNIYYYAGYGKFKEALIVGVVYALLPQSITMSVGIALGVYGGLKARNDLPIGEVPFSWGKVGLLALIVISIAIASEIFIYKTIQI